MTHKEQLNLIEFSIHECLNTLAGQGFMIGFSYNPQDILNKFNNNAKK